MQKDGNERNIYKFNKEEINIRRIEICQYM